MQVLANVLRGYDTAPVNRPSEEPAAVRERLQSLGYVGTGPAPAREHYTEADDPKRLIDSDRKMRRRRRRSRRPASWTSRPPCHGASSRSGRTPKTPTGGCALNLLAAGPVVTEAIETLERRSGTGHAERSADQARPVPRDVGQADKAIPCSSTTAGDDPDALVTLGNAYDVAGKPADALRTYRRLLAADPTSGLAYGDIGTIQLQAGEYTDAEASLRRAVALDPTLADAYNALGALLREDESPRRCDRRVEAIRRARRDGT